MIILLSYYNSNQICYFMINCLKRFSLRNASESNASIYHVNKSLRQNFELCKQIKITDIDQTYFDISG